MIDTNKKLLREFKGKKILITGGSGSIGINIAKNLLKYSPKSIRILSNDENSIVESRKILNNNPSCIFLVGDIRDKDRLNLALRGVDIVFHAGALSSKGHVQAPRGGAKLWAAVPATERPLIPKVLHL